MVVLSQYSALSTFAASNGISLVSLVLSKICCVLLLTGGFYCEGVIGNETRLSLKCRSLRSLPRQTGEDLKLESETVNSCPLLATTKNAGLRHFCIGFTIYTLYVFLLVELMAAVPTY